MNTTNDVNETEKPQAKRVTHPVWFKVANA